MNSGTDNQDVSTLDQRTDSIKGTFILHAAYVLLLFLLMREWLLPIAAYPEVTGVYRIEPFLWAVLGYLFLQYIRCPLLLSVWLKALITLAVIAHFFHQESLLKMTWWRGWMETMRADLEYVFAHQWHLISGEMRTFLFLYGWSLAVYVVYALLIERKKAGWFVIATLLYLLFLQYAWGADTAAGIVRAFAIGMLVVLLSRHAEVIAAQLAAGRIGPGLFTGAIVLVTATLMSAWLAGAVAAQNPQPVFLSRPIQTEKTGYGTDDSRLGGRLERDRRVVFIARTTELAYWKGETKWEYDGSGWRAPQNVVLPANDLLPADPLPPQETEWIQEVMPLDEQLPRILFHGGELVQVQRLLDQDGRPILTDDLLYARSAGKFLLPGGRFATYYRITVRPDGGEESLPDWTDSEDYLQLPETLPHRVRELAETIAGSLSDPYEKAKALEHFLQHEYAYTLEDTAPPPAGRDFVDHFLFEQKAGYCNHFSTAMVILLRTQGVPARWVKGFAPGEVTGMSDGMYEVTVRSEHAHSWVEAYIPGRGWVAFEPTPGFASHENAEADGVLEASAPLAEAFKKRSLSPLNERSLLQELREQLKARLPILNGHGGYVRIAGIASAALAAVILSSVALSKAMRAVIREWRCMRAYCRLRRSQNTEEALPLLAGLWRWWFELHGGRRPSQTLREYVAGLSSMPVKRKEAMLRFMQESERLCYDDRPRGRGWNRRLAKWWKESRG